MLGYRISRCFRGLKQPLFGVFRGLILLKAFLEFSGALNWLFMAVSGAWKRPFLEFSGALFHLKPFWLFPGPETDGIWLFKVNNYFLISFIQKNYKPQTEWGIQKEDHFLNNFLFTNLNFHQYASFMLKTSDHIDLFAFLNSLELNIV